METWSDNVTQVGRVGLPQAPASQITETVIDSHKHMSEDNSIYIYISYDKMIRYDKNMISNHES